MSCIACPVPHIGVVTVPLVGKNNPMPVRTARKRSTRDTRISPTRRKLHRCTEIGLRAGAIDRNSASRSRPSSFIC
jgi:hypothetical protein